MITSNTNSQIKNINNLLSKSKYRKENNKFVVEGVKMVLETPDYLLDKIYVSETFSKGNDEVMADINSKHAGNVELVSDSVFNQMSDTKTPQGIMAVVKMPVHAVEDIIGDERAFVMVLEDIQDPGNLGTIIRTAEGAGVSGVVMSRGTVDIFNPKTIRSTMGSIYRVPFVYTDDLHGTIRDMKKNKIKVYAAHLLGENSYSEEDYTDKTAFLIGNEGNGLRDETAALSDRYIKIPMAGKVESLNAAISSAILMYEANRQRRG